MSNEPNPDFRSDSFPLVSICVPTFNGEKFLSAALSSIEQQSYRNLEVVISDDSSKDSTIEIVEEFKIKAGIPVHIYHHFPSGIGANWNNCIKYAKGKYVKFLFQDDVLYPDCIRKMLEIAEQDKRIGLVYCRRSFIFDSQNDYHNQWISKYSALHTHWDDITAKTGYIGGLEYLRDRNLLTVPLNKIGEPTAALIAKSSFKVVGFFNEELKQALDVEFWFRLMKHFKIGFVNEELVYFRLHYEQASTKNHYKGISETEKLKLYTYRHLFWELHPRNRWKLFKKFSKTGFYFRKLKSLKT